MTKRDRHGEPVRVVKDDYGRDTWWPGTIVSGDDEAGYMVACEPNGYQVHCGVERIRPEVGGLRPFWLKKHRKEETP